MIRYDVMPAKRGWAIACLVCDLTYSTLHIIQSIAAAGGLWAAMRCGRGWDASLEGIPALTKLGGWQSVNS